MPRAAKRDRYQRLIAVCYTEIKINAYLVRQGLALAYRKYSNVYVGKERATQAERLGLWDGEFQSPWDWRKARSDN